MPKETKKKTVKKPKPDPAEVVYLKIYRDADRLRVMYNGDWD